MGLLGPGSGFSPDTGAWIPWSCNICATRLGCMLSPGSLKPVPVVPILLFSGVVGMDCGTVLPTAYRFFVKYNFPIKDWV